jgi:hypothetical protein
MLKYCHFIGQLPRHEIAHSVFVVGTYVQYKCIVMIAYFLFDGRRKRFEIKLKISFKMAHPTVTIQLPYRPLAITSC